MCVLFYLPQRYFEVEEEKFLVQNINVLHFIYNISR